MHINIFMLSFKRFFHSLKGKDSLVFVTVLKKKNVCRQTITKTIKKTQYFAILIFSTNHVSSLFWAVTNTRPSSH